MKNKFKLSLIAPLILVMSSAYATTSPDLDKNIKKEGCCEHKMFPKMLTDINQASLTSKGVIDATENYIVITLKTVEIGTEAKKLESLVFERINKTLDKLNKEKGNDKEITIENGNYYIYDLDSNKNKESPMWRAEGTLIIKGEDINKIKEITKNSGMLVSDIKMGLSPKKQDELKKEAIKLAVMNFQNDAKEYSQLFGFDNYIIKNVNMDYFLEPLGQRARLMTAVAYSSNEKQEDSGTMINITPKQVQVNATISGVVIMEHDYKKIHKNKTHKEVNNKTEKMETYKSKRYEYNINKKEINPYKIR